MIYTGNILKTEPDQFDEVWVICRAVEELEDMFHTYKNVLHIPGLAPSEELFKYYRNLVHLGEWDRKHFDENYVPQFLNGLQNNVKAKKLLHVLVNLSAEKSILLACFCTEERICHRSIIAGILINMGAKIDCNQEYSRYQLRI